MNKVRLNILGVSYSQTQSGAYALILAEENGKRRLPIMIGGSEAQSIAIKLENMETTRPLTHDLFVSLASMFNIYVTEVNIHKLEEGIFYSELVCDNGKIKTKIDARTSDAIALALRFRCPIYTTEHILSKAGIILDFEENKKSEKQTSSKQKTKEIDEKELEKQKLEELEKMLKQAIEEENYEFAAELKEKIKSLKK